MPYVRAGIGDLCVKLLFETEANHHFQTGKIGPRSGSGVQGFE